MASDLEIQLREKIDNKTKPLGALGRIEELALQIGLVQGTTTPVMDNCRLTIFAGDHGIAAEGVSAFPQEVTAQMVLNFLGGGAAANVFANTNGVDLRVVDTGIVSEIDHPNLAHRRMGPGTANSAENPAMSPETLDAAISEGVSFGRAGQVQAVCLGEMGIANTSAATLVAHKIIGAPLEELVGRGTGLDEKGLAHKLNVLTRAAKRTGQLDARTAMQEYGGFEMAMMTGAMIGAATTGRIVIVDGFIASASALCAIGIAPEVRASFVFSHRSAETGHATVLAHMQAKPLFDLDLRLGEGTGAVLAWPLIKSAAAMLNDMASFDSAAISGAV